MSSALHGAQCRTLAVIIDRALNALIQFAFRQFYTRFAWTYDTVASIVSFGEWRRWGEAAIPFLPEGRLLEIAHGPGHLHATLRQAGREVIGFDLSPQMGRLAQQRTTGTGVGLPALIRADAAQLPFADAGFDGAVATFPAGFIFLPATLAELRRVIRPAGRCVIVPAAGFKSTGVTAQIVELAYRVTGQRRPMEAAVAALHQRAAVAGFALHTYQAETAGARVAVWVLGPVAG
jgi:ubiquinone/menaquinone biosynthesis C-methylase UbiE